ncbi:MAG: antitoxin [Acidimicrobiia bacterium]|nr:antitoxin [Acidimicrobiia bacterium]MDH5238678.1 antitoxin [Acidimicrobiia bacterium]
MGFLDRFRKNKMVDKALDAASGAGDKVASGVDKATDFVDEKTGGKFTEHLDKVDDAAEKLGDEVDEQAPDEAGDQTP